MQNCFWEQKLTLSKNGFDLDEDISLSKRLMRWLPPLTQLASRRLVPSLLQPAPPRLPPAPPRTPLSQLPTGGPTWLRSTSEKRRARTTVTMVMPPLLVLLGVLLVVSLQKTLRRPHSRNASTTGTMHLGTRDQVRAAPSHRLLHKCWQDQGLGWTNGQRSW